MPGLPSLGTCNSCSRGLLAGTPTWSHAGLCLCYLYRVSKRLFNTWPLVPYSSQLLFLWLLKIYSELK